MCTLVCTLNVYAYMCELKIEMNFQQNRKTKKVPKHIASFNGFFPDRVSFSKAHLHHRVFFSLQSLVTFFFKLFFWKNFFSKKIIHKKNCHQKVTKLFSKKKTKLWDNWVFWNPGTRDFHVWLPPIRTPVRVFRMSKLTVLGGGEFAVLYKASWGNHHLS